ncbi:MAG: spore coat protein H [Cyclobacteriaceae bacterium]|jgi:spore coat protein H
MRYFKIFVLFLAPIITKAQFKEVTENILFNDISVPKIEITISTDDLNYLLDSQNASSDLEFPATFKYSSDLFTAIEGNVGFRLRGNTSRNAAKKSYKVAFNSFEKGRDLEGLEKLNLNGEHNDPTIIRSKLCWDILNSLNVPSSRCNHLELYINGDYFGLYANVEHVDEEFVKSRFENNDGNLFKCLWPADLKYKGDSPDSYKFESGGRKAYELTTNEAADDYSGLANFIKVLNQTTNTNFEEEISKVFDVTSYLKALAVEVLVAHWDNYGINQNNFYLYENPDDGKFYYIPYDLDNTLGVDWFDVDWAEWNIYEWFRDDRPLTKRIMEVDRFRAQFSQIIYGLLSNQFSPQILKPRIDQLKAMIQDAAERDEYRTYDYQFTIENFNSSFENRLDQFQVRYGLKEYIDERHKTALEQLDDITLSNVSFSKDILVYPNPAFKTINLTLPVEYHLSDVTIYSLDGKLVFSQHYQVNQIKIEPELLNGMYLLKINPGSYGETSVRKIFISE